MKKRFDVIALGVAVMDIIASPVDKSVFGREKTVLDELILSPGGDAVNQSISLSKLGLDVSLCCRVGMDGFGKQILDAVKEAGGDVSHAMVSPSSSTSGAVVLVSPSGQRNIMFKRGNNYDFCAGDIDMEYITEARALSIASIFGMPKLEEEEGLLEILKSAKGNGLITFADMGSDKKCLGLKGVSPLLPYIDYFLPSEGDVEYLTGEKDCRRAAEVLNNEGAKNIVIKLGAKGAYARCESYEGYCEPFAIEPKDTTGAGDAFCAGFIYGTLKGYTVKHALGFACACGAFNSLYLGASSSPVSPGAIEEFMLKTPKTKYKSI